MGAPRSAGSFRDPRDQFAAGPIYSLKNVPSPRSKRHEADLRQTECVSAPFPVSERALRRFRSPPHLPTLLSLCDRRPTTRPNVGSTSDDFCCFALNRAKQARLLRLELTFVKDLRHTIRS